MQRHGLYRISRAQWISLQARPAMRQVSSGDAGPQTNRVSHRERSNAYLRACEAKDLPAIADMLTDDVRLCDWNRSVRGRQAVLDETRRDFESVDRLEIRPGTIHESTDGTIAVLCFADIGGRGQRDCRLGAEDLRVIPSAPPALMPDARAAPGIVP